MTIFRVHLIKWPPKNWVCLNTKCYVLGLINFAVKVLAKVETFKPGCYTSHYIPPLCDD